MNESAEDADNAAAAAASVGRRSAPLNPYNAGHLLLPDVSELGALLRHPFTVGATYYSADACVEYTAGDAALIVSVPHGGHLSSESADGAAALPASSLPDRAAGCQVKDVWTQELGRALHSELCRLLSPQVPHLVIARLHRRKLDLNRQREDSCESEQGRAVWDAYQRCILRAKQHVAARHALGLFVDLHGQAHDSRSQLGFLLNAQELSSLVAQRPDVTPEACSPLPVCLDKLSLHALWLRSPLRPSLRSLLCGAGSLGALLESRGFPCLPSPSSPCAEPGLLYFNGGANTARHGSAPVMLQRKRERAAAEAGGADCGEWQAELAVGSAVSSLQIETAYAGIRDSAAHRRAFAQALADSLQRFRLMHWPQEAAA